MSETKQSTSVSRADDIDWLHAPIRPKVLAGLFVRFPV